MSENPNFPQVGQTTRAYCKDLDRVTDWSVTKEKEEYIWVCDDCGKKVTIGTFKDTNTGSGKEEPKGNED
ncbi:MAG TPA: hypothetical protein VJ844_05090 [Mucilaginibacter sp.]|nr:hypothetical protein [Mucilaginibacter sp.]